MFFLIGDSYPYCLNLGRLSSFWKNLISPSVLINISNNSQRHDRVELFVVSVFQDNKAQRLRALKTFEGTISIGNVNLIDNYCGILDSKWK